MSTFSSGDTPDDASFAIHRARNAALQVEHWPQPQIDKVVATVGWECFREGNAWSMAALSASSTGLGDVEDLYNLHRRRVLGILRDLHGVRTIGVIEESPDRGIARLAKPIGVIVATCPATAPCTTAIINVLPMLKTRNAVVIVPSPRGRDAVAAAVDLIRETLKRAGAPVDLVQCVVTENKPEIGTLMGAADLVVATGGTGSLQRAYSSGTPAIGAGVGNTTVIVDDTADLTDAAQKIAIGAGFNNGTSCSSESNVLVASSVADAFAEQLATFGVHICSPSDVDRLRQHLWNMDGTLRRDTIGKSAVEVATQLGLTPGEVKTVSLAAPMPTVDPADPLFGEKLAPVFTLTTFERFDEAIINAQQILTHSGNGHSCSIHTRSEQNIAELARRIPVARLLVNQSTALGNTGSFSNGMPFSPTLACGTWGGCAQSENITWRNFLNYTTVSRPIAEVMPDEETIFAPMNHEVTYAGRA